MNDETHFELFKCMLEGMAIESEMESVQAELEAITTEFNALQAKRDELWARFLTLKERHAAYKAHSKALGV